MAQSLGYKDKITWKTIQKGISKLLFAKKYKNSDKQLSNNGIVKFNGDKVGVVT